MTELGGLHSFWILTLIIVIHRTKQTIKGQHSLLATMIILLCDPLVRILNLPHHLSMLNSWILLRRTILCIQNEFRIYLQSIFFLEIGSGGRDREVRRQSYSSSSDYF